MKRREVRVVHDELSRAERRVLQALADYDKTEEIAAELGLRPKTVKNHIMNACQKLGVHSRHRPIVEAFRRGLIERPSEPHPR